MGYTTYFEGRVTVSPPLNPGEVSFLKDFCNTRRMHRENGPLFVAGSGFMGQGSDADVYDRNHPPRDQPGLWCHWAPSEDGTYIEWDGGEKFYYADDWMKYIVTNLLAPSAREYLDAHLSEDWRLPTFTCDHIVNGEIEAQGEESGDMWKLIVRDNQVFVSRAQTTFTDPEPV